MYFLFTAEQVFSRWPGIEVVSAGLDPASPEPVGPELLAWANLIFVMEQTQKSKLSRKFRACLKDERILVLGIPDEYQYLDEICVR